MGKHARRRQSRLGARVAGTTGALTVALSAGVGSAAAAGKSTGTPMTAATAWDDVAQAPCQAAALDVPPTPGQLTLPAPSGRLRVGTVDLHLRDSSCMDPWTPRQQSELLAARAPGPVDCTGSGLGRSRLLVVTMDHTYDSGDVVFPGGRHEVNLMPPGPKSRHMIAIRAAGTHFVIDQLDKIARGHNPDVEHKPLPHGLTQAASTKQASSSDRRPTSRLTAPSCCSVPSTTTATAIGAGHGFGSTCTASGST